MKTYWKLCPLFWTAILAVTLLGAARSNAGEARTTEKKYEASWESLNPRPTPEWLLDAKFGIYAHWGLYSVPAYGNEWYGKQMYDKSNVRNIYQHHLETYGGPEKFSYRDFIPLFKAEKYDPEEWADLIAKSGAKYAGIAVVHHDGFDLWDSKVNRWNAANMGPKRDLYGDLVKALRKKDLKIIATFHHLRTFNWFVPEKKEYLEEAKRKNYDIFDPQYKDFFWNEYTSTYEDFLKVWREKVREVVEKHQPDVLWFDGGEFQEENTVRDVMEILAFYYNKGREWGKGVEVLNKFPTTKKFNFPREFGVLTFEAGRDRPDFVDLPWVDDDKIGNSSWGYVEGLEYKTVNYLVDSLADRVSRNGGLLLSLSPKADGTLPQEQKDILLGLGKWLSVNGEAIYGTRPWKIQAEGDIEKMRAMVGPHLRWDFNNCTAEDIRFTRKGHVLYAIALGWPEGGEVAIKTLKTGMKISAGGIASVSLLGSNEKVKWTQDDRALTIKLPKEKPCEHACAFKIELKGEMVLE